MPTGGPANGPLLLVILLLLSAHRLRVRVSVRNLRLNQRGYACHQVHVYMGSPHDFDAVHYGTQFAWCPACRPSGPANAGTPNRRFMESPLSGFFRMYLDHEPAWSNSCSICYTNVS